MKDRLNIAFVWHMHQPMYRDPSTGEYFMPWVLLHGTKDYLDMASILEEFPDVHQTFNYVPCLTEQLEEYGTDKVSDLYRKMTLKPAAELTVEDKSFILQNFFQANWEQMIRPLPRYMELLVKRGISGSPDEIRSVLRYFREEDYRDLQVLFNLSWVDPHLRANDEKLAALVKKERNYTEADKLILIERQTAIINAIVPKHRELEERGIIEVTTTPYYHPILPLLCDSHSAKEAMPWATLPERRFLHPEDARAQISKAVERHTDTFGRAPRGMWPSEGSVSTHMLPLVAEAGINWIATDEEILSNTIRRPIRRDHSGNCYDTFLYRPYKVRAGDRELSVIFRDHVLSDLIGFDYARMHPDAAASDLVGRLTHIYNLIENPGDHIVSIILDGENAWEGYTNDGRDFFVSLYRQLSGHPLLKCVTVSEFLDARHHREHLDWIYPGSWISHNFKIWIGHPEDNAAWDFIMDAREALVKYAESVEGTLESVEKKAEIAEAWELLYAAEGSDWFWWYGEDHSTMSDEHFDTLFRRYIKRIYELIGLEPPLALEEPITTEAKGRAPDLLPTAFIEPVIDGEVTNYFEWLAAGIIDRQQFSGAMHRAVQGTGFIAQIAYGFSREKLYLRFDYTEPHQGYEKPWSFVMTFIAPEEVRIETKIEGTTSWAGATVRAQDNGDSEEGPTWVKARQAIEIASDSVVELAIPLEMIGADESTEIRFSINIDAAEDGLERWPVKGYLTVDMLSPEFEEEDWLV